MSSLAAQTSFGAHEAKKTGYEITWNAADLSTHQLSAEYQAESETWESELWIAELLNRK